MTLVVRVNLYNTLAAAKYNKNSKERIKKMNNKNNALLHNDVEINASEEKIILAPPVELFDEAKEISQSAHSNEKFPFALQHDSN